MFKLKVGFLLDKNNNWIIHDIRKFVNNLNKKKFIIKISYNYKKFLDFDILFILNYTKIINSKVLDRIKLPIVLHASNLPNGKGFAPLIWQVLENKKNIKVTMIKAVKKVDSGPIIFKNTLKLNGAELYSELRKKLSNIIIKLINKLLINYPNIKFIPQKGNSTFYKKRTPENSKININKSIKSQFNLLRTCNNEKWPAFFYFKKKKYIIKILENEI
jgi:methionyl-tRNA formyltransferase